MATNPATLPENAGRITAPTTAYPYGSAKEDSTGTSGDGTPIRAAVMNDNYGFIQAALSAAGIVPSGNAETATESQVLQALQGVVAAFADRKQWPSLVDAGGDNVEFVAGRMPDSEGRLPLVFGGMEKLIDSPWAAGTGFGGLFSGSVQPSTTYHCFLIRRTSDGVVDAGFDTDLQAINIPTGYSAYRRIGSVITDSNALITPFVHRGDHFWLQEEVLDATVKELGSGGGTQINGLTIPKGLSNLAVVLRLRAHSRFDSPSPQSYDTVQTSLSMVPKPVPFTVGTDANSVNEFVIEMPVDASAQITTTQSDDSSPTLTVYTQGWIDDRSA